MRVGCSLGLSTPALSLSTSLSLSHLANLQLELFLGFSRAKWPLRDRSLGRRQSDRLQKHRGHCSSYRSDRMPGRLRLARGLHSGTKKCSSLGHGAGSYGQDTRTESWRETYLALRSPEPLLGTIVSPNKIPLTWSLWVRLEGQCSQPIYVYFLLFEAKFLPGGLVGNKQT